MTPYFDIREAYSNFVDRMVEHLGVDSTWKQVQQENGNITGDKYQPGMLSEVMTYTHTFVNSTQLITCCVYLF